MKKNIALRLASGLMLSCLLSTCVISGTFAKYTSSSTGSDTAHVAKWDIKLKDTAMEETFTFDLFNTIKDSNGTDTETDIKIFDGTIIAPGTSGSFEINLKNDSEVTAQYAIDFTEINGADLPIEYALGTSSEANWKDSIDELDFVDSNANKTLSMGGTATEIVYWRWKFESDNDVLDTYYGINGATITVTATVTVTQVD